MHAGQDLDRPLDLPMVTPRPSVPSGPLPPAHGSFAPPRLTPLAAPGAARRVSADLRFPGDLVYARAQEYAREARITGSQHTLKLWRECCHEALVALARIATASPNGTVCESLTWQLDGEDYTVSIVLAQPAAPLVH